MCTEFLYATTWNTEGLGLWFAHSAQAHTQREREREGEGEREKAEVREEGGVNSK